MKPVAQPRSAGLGLLTEGHAFPLADLEPQGKIVPKSAESVLFGTNISRLAQDRWMRPRRTALATASSLEWASSFLITA